MKAITYEPSSTSPVVSTPFAQVQATPDLERIEAQARSILSITGNLDVDEFYSIFPRFMHGELLGIGHDAVSRAREILKAKRNSQELKSDNQTQQIGTRQRRTIPRISSRSTFNTFLEMKHRNNRAWESAGDSTDESAVSPRPRRMSSGSYMETKALQDLEQREEEAALRQRAVSTFTASAVNESPSAAESTRIPQATFIEQITTVQDIEKEFIQLQHRRKDDISKAQEITKRLQSTGISDDTQTLEEIQAIMRIMATANANSFSTLSASNLKNLHGMITTNTSIEDSAKNPFNWGIKLVEEQDYLKLFMLQFYIGLFPLFLFEPWKFSFYITLKTGLRKILMTSRINYHGDISFLSLVVSRTIIALIPFMHVLFKHDIFGLSKYEYYQVYVYNGRNRRMIPQRRRRRGHWTLNPRWLLLMCWTMFSIAMNSIAFIAVDFTGFRFQPDFLLDLYWTLWGVSVFIFWWIIASGFRIRLGEYDISHWNVWFLLAVVFFFGDSCA